MDLVLAGGTLIDGTGQAPRHANIGFDQGRIIILGETDLPQADMIVDAAALVICPGFVDIHTHSDLSVIADPAAVSCVTQGVTTAVVGNCGLGIVPLAPETSEARRREIVSAASYLYVDPAYRPTWSRTRHHLRALAQARTAINLASLVPHLPLHASVVGFGSARATASQIEQIRRLALEGLDDGALGISTGLAYSPLGFADDRELTALGEVAASRDVVFAWHIRDYGDDLVESVRQALAVAERTGCRIQISHLCAIGRRNWGKVADVLDLVQEVRSRGLDVRVDTYPYLAGNAPLSQLLPDWARVGDEEEWRRSLLDETIRSRVTAEWQSGFAVGWDQVTVLPRHGMTEPGMTAPTPILDLAVERGGSPEEVALDLMADHGSGINIIAGGRSADDLATVLAHPATVIASDGISFDPAGPTGQASTHPRSYGCFPRYLSGVGVEDLPDAIRRCTSEPARIVGLTDRGVIKDGAPADVVVLDPTRLIDLADFQQPHQLSRGVDWVFVNGEAVLTPAGPTSARPGRVLTQNGDPC